MLQAVTALKGFRPASCPILKPSGNHDQIARSMKMLVHEFQGRTDLRDEAVLAVIALLIPLATLPAMIGL